MLGKKHREIVDWLVKDWGADGRRVCVIEGFSGVGKTEVAWEFEGHAPVTARIDVPETGDLDDLLLALSEQLAASGNADLANLVASGKSVESGFEALLLKPVCIVIDEFQRLVDTSKGAPIPAVAGLIERITKRSAPGRLMLLSHHALDKTLRWGERVAFKTLEGLEPDEGAQLLGQLLAQRGRELDIPPSRRSEISSWLGGNPRGLRVLVGCLEQEALDDLTGVVPEAWEARDQQVSANLIAALERELLLRALENLDGASASTLEGIAVYRKATDREGITRLLSQGLLLDNFIAALSSRFLLDHRAGWYSVNPVVREISLRRLKLNVRAARTAHRQAAGHYTKHFSGKQIVNASKLGGTFIEARYHLVQSGDVDELAEITHRFGAHLRSIYGWGSPSAIDEKQRDEVIAVLSAFLQDGGPKAMDYYLARLLSERRKDGDIQRGLEHVRRSTGAQSPASAWVLRLRLEGEVAGVEPMLAAARQGMAAVPPDENLFSVYKMAADQLTAAGRVVKAMELLEEGISRIPPDNGLFSLYLAEAELLESTGQVDDAIQLLRQGLVQIPADHVASLYVRATHLLVGKGKVNDAVELLGEGIARIPPEKDLVTLYITLSETLANAGRPEDALHRLEEGVQKIPTAYGRSRLQEMLVDLADSRAADATIGIAVNAESAIPNLDSLSEGQHAEVVRSRRLCILAVGTEWESRHGGLSTFNRDLCVELAASGHQVVCVVPETSALEMSAAQAAGVCVIHPVAGQGLVGAERLLLDIPLPQDFKPDIVIGHDRKTGPYAKVLAERYSGAKLALFVHTRPEDIEWHKDKLGPDDAGTTAEERRLTLQNLACAADLVVGVGPALAASARSLVHLAEPRPLVHRMDPGFRVVPRRPGLPPEMHCLLLGRAEDLTLKGLDIAASALGRVTQRNKLSMSPRLIVRGAPIGTGGSLRTKLMEFGGGKLEVEVRDYSANVERLQNDILMSSLVLMPSRSEGFGLVALEAIAASVPVLVSDRSGFATLLTERLAKDAQPFIVETHDDLGWSAGEWERSMEAVLIDRDAAFARARNLQSKLTGILEWSGAIRSLEEAWAPLIGAAG
ncbi:glycosyltransferase [Paraburkholderia sp. SIMBA_049]